MSRTEWSMTKLCVLVTTALVLCLVLGAAPVGAVSGVRYVDQNLTRNCGGNTPCHTTIQAAVIAAQPGDTIYVYPGTYGEGVNLNAMPTDGDLALVTVNNGGVPTPGTVTVNNPGDNSEIYTGDPLMPFNGSVTIDGFVLRSAYGAIDLWVGPGAVAPQGGEMGLGPVLGYDVEIRNVDASHTGGDGISVRGAGNVTIKDCTTNDNQGYGIGVWGTLNDNQGYGIGVWGTLGDVTITGCTSNDNKGPAAGLGGATLVCPAGGICVVGAHGQVVIRNSTANGNGADGVYVGGPLIDGGLGVGRVIDGGDVIIENCTVNGNHQAGFDPDDIWGTLSVQACIARDNRDGVDLGYTGADSVLVNGSIICGNECGVYLGGESLRGTVGGINLEGNWWGCAGGPKPEGQGCDPICEPQEDSILVDFTPWISKISASATVDPVNVGEPTVVSFQFSANPSAVYLGQGPGDLRGPAPFTVATNNGTLNGNGATVQEFVGANGTLEVTLVPSTAGTATVWVDGPCGLADLEGATAVLGVESEFVPEPGSVMLLGSGLVGLAGYAALRLRSGQGLRLRKR